MVAASDRTHDSLVFYLMRRTVLSASDKYHWRASCSLYVAVNDSNGPSLDEASWSRKRISAGQALANQGPCVGAIYLAHSQTDIADAAAG